VRFTETPRSKPAPRRTAGETPGTVPVPDARDHRAWSHYWADQCVSAMTDFIETGNPIAMEHAVRSARACWARICRAEKYYYWDPTKREGSI